MKTVLVLIMIIAGTTLFSQTYIITQDGTGDYTSIQAGINAASNGDILLVYPGIYYENINYLGKDITITSLYDGNEYDESYIAATVIDGDYDGTVVVFDGNETRGAMLNGFTIRNGRGELHDFNDLAGLTQGGGFFIKDASPVISHCIIEHNYAALGGGILFRGNGNPLFRGNTIRYNSSTVYGGGFLAANLSADNADMEFDTGSMNNIYFNSSLCGSDIYFVIYGQTSPVVIDTFTVLQPDVYFCRLDPAVHPDLTLTINQGKVEPVAADLYVSPGGSDTNSGLTPEEALRSISRAMSMIAPDSLQQRTIHLGEGVYSPSLNDQLFPVQLRKYITVSGAGKAETIIDGENRVSLFGVTDFDTYHVVPVIRGYALRNMTLINGGNLNYVMMGGAISLHYTADYSLENIDITQCHTKNSLIIATYGCEGDLIFRDLHLYDNSGGTGAISLSLWQDNYELYAENIRIRNHLPGPDDPYATGSGGGMKLSLSAGYIPDFLSTGTIVNLEVTNCLLDPFNLLPFGNLWFIGPQGNWRVINATIGNNSSTNATGGGISIFERRVHVEIINSIIYGNTPHNITFRNDFDDNSSLTISHSLVEGGEDGIYYFGNPCNVEAFWGEGNIDANPLWLGDLTGGDIPEYPYMLSENSPARNAGTLDIPGFEFPEYDLAGNPRISGSTIDMGAYEYQSVATGYDEELPDLSVHDYRLRNFPNPTLLLHGLGRGEGVGTRISFILPVEGEVVIDIYNVKGQFVRRLFEARIPSGEHEVVWNGKDEQERLVSSGFYLYKLEVNGRTVAAGKCTFVK